MTKRQTRSELVRSNLELAKTSNAHVATVHLGDDMNLAFVIRAAACFGAKSVMVIGSLPPYRILRQLSVGLNNFIEIQQFSTPEHFLQHCRDQNIAVFSIELCDQAVSIYDLEFPKQEIVITTGHETTGVPQVILHKSQPIYIPMPGVGLCLNTSQAANVALYEYNRQMRME